MGENEIYLPLYRDTVTIQNKEKLGKACVLCQGEHNSQHYSVLAKRSSNDRSPSCLTTAAPIHCNQTQQSKVIHTDLL